SETAPAETPAPAKAE
nr:MUMP-1=gamma interferon-activated antimicrobial protein {N-terminal} [mice, BALB/c, macrophage cell line RAW264.7, Peptide Partial, 15 aa] [Mus sp.]